MNRRSWTYVLLVLVSGCLLIGMAATSSTVQAQQAAGRKTVWSGVFSEDAATRGDAVYKQYCVNCHGVEYEGDPSSGGPPLAGAKFMENWREDTAETLFWKIRKTMPRSGFRGSEKVLSDREALDIVALMFKKNNFPAGSEIAVTDLGGVRIEQQDGPKPLPNYAQVQIVGCMQQTAGNWELVQAAPPTRLRGAAESIEPEVLKAAETKPLGDLKFRLQNLIMLGAFKPEDHKGHRMLAQGVLIRQGGSERVSVTKLEMVAATCGQ